MNPARRILVVEDERDLAEILSYNLKKAGYHVMLATDGGKAVQLLSPNPPDLVILDVMIPVISGIEVARHIRANTATAHTPIIMLTAKAEEADQVTGLTAGADDYVTKPFSIKVLLARIEAQLRRATPSANPGAGEDTGVLEVGQIRADLAAHNVTSENMTVKLTLTEFKLLIAMLAAPKRVLSRNDLIQRVMGPGIIVTARTIDVHIASIRKKLGTAGGQIRTIRGVGYQLMTEPSIDDELANEPTPSQS
jgi:DNA-binding response OmpR family regulator